MGFKVRMYGLEGRRNITIDAAKVIRHYNSHIVGCKVITRKMWTSKSLINALSERSKLVYEFKHFFSDHKRLVNGDVVYNPAHFIDSEGFEVQKALNGKYLYGDVMSAWTYLALATHTVS